jgi:DUF1365 family protein
MSVGWYLWVLVRYPLITWAVQLLIHVQAFNLWLKKVRAARSWVVRSLFIARAPFIPSI